MTDLDQTEPSAEADPAAPLNTVFAAAGWRMATLLHPPHLGRRGALLAALFVALIWIASGIFAVGPDEQGVVLTFGRRTAIVPPGLHYHLPYPVGAVLLPKVTAVNQTRSASGAGGAPSRMLSGDENIVEADYSVEWKIRDAGAYLFGVDDPEALVRRAAETAVRDVIGRNPIQDALSDRRHEIAAAAQEELQSLLDAYGAGILVVRLQLQRVDPPTVVIDAFNDVQRARADQVRARNEAEAYRNDILPRARGEADHILQQAQAYRTQAVDSAKGDVDAFAAAYKAYQQAPQIFSWRLYLDSMDDLLRHASRVVIDATGKNVGPVLPYLPLGEATRRGGAAPEVKP